jgi:hypothetical protein
MRSVEQNVTNIIIIIKLPNERTSNITTGDNCSTAADYCQRQLQVQDALLPLLLLPPLLMLPLLLVARLDEPPLTG